MNVSATNSGGRSPGRPAPANFFGQTYNVASPMPIWQQTSSTLVAGPVCFDANAIGSSEDLLFLMA